MDKVKIIKSNLNPRYLCISTGQIYDTLRNKMIKPTINPETQYEAFWCYINNERKFIYVHHFIYFAFNNIKQLPPKFQIDHIDNDRHNNNLNNLQLLSQKDNIIKSKSRKYNQYKELDHQHYIKKKRRDIFRKEFLILNNIEFF